MEYDAEKDRYILSSGKSFATNLGIIGLGPGVGRGCELTYGCDGSIDMEFTIEERYEIFGHMIDLWTKWMKEGT
jgi:hypothetical protein